MAAVKLSSESTSPEDTLAGLLSLKRLWSLRTSEAKTGIKFI